MQETISELVEDKAGNKIPLPDGFSPITTADQGNKDTGFVIKNDTDGNEFVWVPCTVDGTNGSIKYDRYVFLSSQPQNGIDETTQSIKIMHGLSSDYYYIEKMPEDEKESIKAYGGFYIGRYEAGIKDYTSLNTTVANNIIEYTGYVGGKLVIQPNKQPWNYITRNKAKIEAEKLYNKANGNSVTSKLCSSYVWDTTLKFIEKQNSEYLTNSVGGYYGQSAPTTTGYDKTHPCNIYDMGGNVQEWTTEENRSNTQGYPYEARGGSFLNASNEWPTAFRAYNGTTNVYNNIGFRVAIFL